jgi:hypothetical protein
MVDGGGWALSKNEAAVPGLADGIPLAAAAGEGRVSVMGSDYTPEYVAALRRMSGAEKIRAAFRLYDLAKKIKAARVREEHPDWTEDQVRRRVNEIFLYAVT